MDGKKEFVYMLEGDGDDRMITSSTLHELDIDIPVIYFGSNEELLAALNGGKRPLLILLDYHTANTEEMNLLKRLKSDPGYGDIPVIVLGELSPSGIVRECYRLGASSYIVKPSDLGEIRGKIKTFLKYWLEVAET